MNAIPNAAGRAVMNGSTGRSASRRPLLRLAGIGAVVLGALAATGSTASAQRTLAWDKTFPRSARVDHEKVSFYNRLGLAGRRPVRSTRGSRPWPPSACTTSPRRSGRASGLPRPALNDEEPLVRGHAAWALGRIGTEAARQALQGREEVEEDEWVREEISLTSTA